MAQKKLFKTKASHPIDLLLCTLPNNMDKVMGAGKRFISPIEPLGLMYIAANARKGGFRIGIMDTFAMNYGFYEIISEIRRLSPRVIGFSLLTSQATLYVELARIIRKNFPKLKIVLGNIHASYFAEYFLKKKLCDMVVHGEGEFTTVKLLHAIKQNLPFDNIEGISFQNKGKVIKTGSYSAIENLDDLPPPAWDLVYMDLYKLQFYVDPLAGNPRYFAQLITSRGCTNRCKFCAVQLNNRVRYFSANRVLSDIKTLYEKYGIKFIAFHDAHFTSNYKRLKEVCGGIIARKIKIKWGCDSRVDFICRHPDIPGLLKRAGCDFICFGIESGNQKVLNRCNKNITINGVRMAVKLANEAGLKVHGLFILGLPGDTNGSCLETIDFACRLDLDIAQFAIFTPFPGSVFFDELTENERINPYDWDHYVQYASLKEGQLPAYAPDGMTKEDLVALQRFSFRRFFLRPKIILKFIKKIRLYNLLDYIMAAGFTVIKR